MGNPERHTQSSSKRRVLIVAACVAAATFALLICAEIFLPSKPPSFPVSASALRAQQDS